MNTPDIVRRSTRNLFGSLSLSLVLLVTALPGCNDHLPTSQDEGSAIMPLAVGNRWVGIVHEYSTDGVDTNTYYDTIEITEKFTDKDGTVWYGSNEIDGDSLQTIYKADAEGLSRVTRNLIKGFDPCECRYLPFPVRTGDTLLLPSAYVLLPDGNGGTRVVEQKIGMYVESADMEVTVPLGTFRTIQYRQRLFTPNNAVFNQPIPWMNYKPDVGPIRIEWYKTGDQKVGPLAKSWELVDVRLK